MLLLYFLGQFVRQHGLLVRTTDDLEERTRERDRIWSVSEDLLGVSTFEGYFIAFNPAWSRVLGWSEAEIRRMHVDELRHPDDIEHSRAGRARLAAGVPTVRMENRFRHKDGGWRWIAWTLTADQGLIYVAGRHVTAEKEAQEALRKAEADAALPPEDGGARPAHRRRGARFQQPPDDRQRLHPAAEGARAAATPVRWRPPRRSRSQPSAAPR